MMQRISLDISLLTDYCILFNASECITCYYGRNSQNAGRLTETRIAIFSQVCFYYVVHVFMLIIYTFYMIMTTERLFLVDYWKKQKWGEIRCDKYWGNCQDNDEINIGKTSLGDRDEMTMITSTVCTSKHLESPETACCLRFLRERLMAISCCRKEECISTSQWLIRWVF